MHLLCVVKSHGLCGTGKSPLERRVDAWISVCWYHFESSHFVRFFPISQ